MRAIVFGVFILLFVTLIILVFAGGLAYLREARPKKKYILKVAGLLFSGFVITIAYEVWLGNIVGTGLATLLQVVVSEYLGIMTVITGLTVVVILLVLAKWLGKKLTPQAQSETRSRDNQSSSDDVPNGDVVNPSRRQFLKTSAIAIPAIAGLGGIALGTSSITSKAVVNHVNLTYAKVPDYLKNYRIAQLSDIHLGPFYDLKDFRSALDQVIEEKVNRLVITGDLLDHIDYLDGACQLLDEYFDKIPDGIDYILGNHEYIRALDEILDSIDNTKVCFLRNQNEQLSQGVNPVYLVGVDYPHNRSKTEREEFLGKALQGVPEHAFVILLAHDPMFIEEAAEKNIPLTMAGHTHGGQINFFGISILPLREAYWRGLYTFPNSYGYVNCGLGSWFPIRFNCPSEITIYSFSQKG